MESKQYYVRRGFTALGKFVITVLVVSTLLVYHHHKIKQAKCEGRAWSTDYKVLFGKLYCKTKNKPETFEVYDKI